MESLPDENNIQAAGEPATDPSSYIHDVNVVIREKNDAKNKASWCDVDRLQTEKTRLRPEDKDKVKDFNIMSGNEIRNKSDTCTSIDIDSKDEVQRKVYSDDDLKSADQYFEIQSTDSSHACQYFEMETMASTVAVEDDTGRYMDDCVDDTQPMKPTSRGDNNSIEVGVNDNTIKHEAGNKFFNELYEKEIDMRSNFSEQEISDMRTSVAEQVNLLAKTIEEIDSRFKIKEIIPAGSAHEGTQVVRPCEYDYILVLDNLSKPGAVSLSVSPKHFKNNSLEFVHVKLENIEIRSIFNENIHNDNEILAHCPLPCIPSTIRWKCPTTAGSALQLCMIHFFP